MKTAKNTEDKQINGIFFTCIILFVCFAYYITAFYNRDFLVWADKISLFLPTRMFFMQTMHTAGGLLSYAGIFLTQFFYYPLLGSTILILLLLFIVFLVIKAFEFSPRFFPLAFIPAFALLVSITGIGDILSSLMPPGYLFANILGIITVLLLFWVFKITEKMYKEKSFILYIFPLAIILTYPLFGFYSLFAALLCLLSVSFRIKPLILSISYLLGCLLICLLVPFLFSRYFYITMAWSDTYAAGLPKFFFTEIELSLWMPFIILFFTLLLFFIISYTKAKNKALLYVSFGFFLISLAAAYNNSYRNDNFKTELQMIHAIDNSDWNQVVSIGGKQKKSPTRLIIMCYNLALYKLGQAGDYMFKMDNNSIPSVSSRKNTILMYNGAQPLYYHYGKVNFSYRWGMEFMVRHGLRAQGLKYMVKCALLNNELALATKYNNILKQTFFHKQWADKYQKYIDNPQLMSEDAEMKAIRPLMEYENLLQGDNSQLDGYIYYSFAHMVRGTPEILELSLQNNLILKDIDRFWPRFLLYTRKHDRIPVHYQEAAILYFQAKEGKVDVNNIEFEEMDFSRIDDEDYLKGMEEFDIEFDKTIISRFDMFRKMQNANMSHEYNKKILKPQFGNTYWYYYFYVEEQ